MQTTPRSANGYTLLELMVVLMVIGIMVSTATPSLQGYITQHRRERALDQVASDVALVRLLAVREGRSAALAFVAGGYEIRVRQMNGTAKTVKEVDLLSSYPGIEIDADSDIAFSSRGLLVDRSDEAFVRITSAESTDSIFVSPAGRVYRAY